LNVYAILRAGGKQYRVQAGQMLDIDRIDAEPGATIDLGEVLALTDGEGELTVGTPVVDGAAVKARVMRHHKGEKILVLKYKPKVRYRRLLGHRQHYTRVRIEDIVSGA
jgi:large subunit ribosomal protein L21